MRLTAGKAKGALISGAVTLGLLLAGCTSTAEPQASASAGGGPSASSSPATSPTTSSSSGNNNTMTIDITIANGKTTPSGEKINVPVGEKVILNVTSDTDDEVHAHIGGPGYELEVKAGTPAKGEFTIDSPGSFEVESHHLEKIIVILNAR
jgi:heme/copper-type cytochrome/quinol oxidase subunit 2